MAIPETTNMLNARESRDKGPDPSLKDFEVTTPLIRRLRAILSTQLDSKETYEALEALGECLMYREKQGSESGADHLSTATGEEENDDGSMNRLLEQIQEMDLQAEMQAQMASINDAFVKALSDVNQAFLNIERSVYGIEKLTRDMRNQFRKAEERTSLVATHTADLMEERRDLEYKKELAETFLRRFTVSEDDAEVIRALNEGGGRLDRRIFGILENIDEMRQLCHLYLLVGYPVSASKPGIDVRGERPQQQQRSQQRGDVLGLDVDRALASYEDAGLKGMRRWASNEIRQLSKDTPEFSAELKRAIHALKRRPALHQTVIQDIANTRCEALAYAFIQALVRGGPNGVPRPIDVHAADPVRYLGDMLAWVHQAHASEIELLDTLFIDKDSDHGHADGDDQAVSDVRLENARCRKDVLSLCLEGLCRPLELRVQQTLLAMSEPTQLLKLINFLQFYSQVFAKTCLPDSALMLTMKDMAAHANETFINVLKTRVLDDTANIEISPTLNVPDGCMAVIDLVRDLINIYDASFGLNHDETSPPREEHGSVEDLQVLSEQQILADIFSLSLDQMVERCQSVASTSNLLDYEATILEWNLHSAIRNMMNANESARSWHEKVTAKLGSLESWLEQQLFELINERSGMKFVLECLDNGQQDSLTPAQILALSTKLSEALATGELDLTVQMGRLHSPKVTKAIIATVMTHFVDAYKRVYGFVEAKIGTDATWDSQVDLGTFHRPHVLATLLL